MRKPIFSRHALLAPLLGVSACLLTAPTQAGSPINCGSFGTSCTAPNAGDGNRHKTQAFVGVNWTFGVGPDLVAGLRYTRTNSRQRVTGARLEAVFPFNTSYTQIGLDRLRMRLIGGHRDVMYELGGGYSLSGQGFLASGALQAEHISLGTDLIVGGMQWLPYVGFDTLTKPKRAGGGEVCPSGFTLTDVTTLQGPPFFISTVNAADQVNGHTCYQGGPV